MDIRDLQMKQDELDRSLFPEFSSANPIQDEDLSALLYIALCVNGEAGELANLAKKTYRGDFSLNEARAAIAEELVDIFIYTIKLATQLEISIEDEFVKKLEKNRIRFQDRKPRAEAT